MDFVVLGVGFFVGFGGGVGDFFVVVGVFY